MEEKLYGVPAEEWMDSKPFEEWYQTASPESMKLLDKVHEFSCLFGDMVFSQGTPTFEFIKCQSKPSEPDKRVDDTVEPGTPMYELIKSLRKVPGPDGWIDDTVELPDQLEYFFYSYFTYHVEDLSGRGRFDMKNRSLTIDPAYLDDDSAVLHEMIHLHEFVINSLPTFYHDAIFYCLYKDLASKITDLNERIEAHGHILNANVIAKIGGVHNILFLLKSFDLDLKMGYKLGTVFGYGMVNEGDGSSDAETGPADPESKTDAEAPEQQQDTGDNS